ncbi:MAG: glycosyltransferase [Planctomycetota bacterium]
MANVAFITPTLKAIGGTEIYLRQLIDVQLRQADKITAFTQESSADYDSPVPVKPQGTNLTESLDPFRMAARSGAVKELADQIVQDFDRVEFHRLAPIDLLKALHNRIQTLVFVHTSELTCPSGGRYLPIDDSVCTTRAGLNCLRCDTSQHCLSEPAGTRFPLKQRLRAFSRVPLSREVSRLATCMVFNSQANKTLFARTVEQPQLGRVLPPVVPAPSNATIERDCNKLLYVGRLERSKGILHAIRAARAIDASILHVIGAGSAEQEARRLADKLSVNVVFHGWQNHEVINHNLQTARCLLFPPIGFEAWGMVGPEAISQGCPVVAYDNGGVSEWLSDSCGQVVPAGDLDSLIRAVKNVAPVSESAANRLAEKYGHNAFESNYQHILQSTKQRFEAREKLVIMHVQRQPLEGFHSIELLFHSIRSGMPDDFNLQIREAPFASKGVWRRLLNWYAMRKLKADVFHVTGDVHYLGLGLPAQRTIQTVHDAVFKTRTSGLRRWLIKKLYYDKPLKRAAINVCISKTTRDDIAELINLSFESFEVISNCVPTIFTFQPKQFNKACPEVLLIGTLPHKNQLRVIKALTDQELRLHVVGKLDESLTDAIDASKLKYRNSVDLSSAQMAQAYIDCDMLVFASTFEGFGMPVIEAQTVGRAVVTSNVSSLPEVAGYGAILIDPTSEDAIADAVARICNDDVLRQRLIDAGRENAAKYTPEAVAAEYVKLYRRILDQKKSGSED